MESSLERKFLRDDIWREGRYVDLWSLVHTLSGMIAGLFPLFLPLTFWPALLIATVAFILWELLERFGKIAQEYISNQVTDVLFGMLGFCMSYPLLTFLTRNEAWFVFFALWGVTCALAFFGWRAAVRAQQLRSAFMREREFLRAKWRHASSDAKAEWAALTRRHKKRPLRERVG